LTIEVTLGTVVELCTVGGVVSAVVHWLVSAALKDRDTRIAALEESAKRDREAAEKRATADHLELESAFKAARDTQRTLFEKLDSLHRELTDYKLQVAEKYVGAAQLKELLAPLITRLERIEDRMPPSRTAA
jgi:hypothetical protein